MASGTVDSNVLPGDSELQRHGFKWTRSCLSRGEYSLDIVRIHLTSVRKETVICCKQVLPRALTRIFAMVHSKSMVEERF